MGSLLQEEPVLGWWRLDIWCWRYLFWYFLCPLLSFHILLKLQCVWTLWGVVVVLGTVLCPEWTQVTPGSEATVSSIATKAL